MSKRDPRPEVLRLEELAWQVKSGEIKLPRFQRPFVWNKSDMLKLLDSIYRGYPIGSLLLWNSSQRLKSERDIAGLVVSDEATLYPTSYLLDGQQRLTTLCGALFWKGGAQNSLWNIHFDLDSETFVYPKHQDSITTYPLNKLINTTDFIHQCMKFSHHPDSSKFVARAERLLRAIKDYKIAVVMIGDMSIEEVAPIFERINSTGRKLTMVDLMMAATWSNGFDLSSEISEIISKCEGKGFSGITEQLVLRSIAATAGLGINKDDIQKLRNLSSMELKEASDLCRDAFNTAIQWLMEKIQIFDVSFLPYALFLTYAVEFFHRTNSPSEEQLQELYSWFWFSSATLHFGGASTGDITRDLNSLRDYASGQRPRIFNRSQINIDRLLYDKFNLKNASSTAFALMLLSKNPSVSISGLSIQNDLALSKHSKNFASVGLSDIAEINLSVVFHPIKGALNITAESTNLNAHLLNEACIEAIVSNDTSKFVAARAELIGAIIHSLTGCPITYTSNFIIDQDETDDYDA